MKLEIKVPQLGESITEATINKWHKKIGDAVLKDEIIAELETDKINIEITAESSGVLSLIQAVQGSIVKIGEVIGALDSSEEQAKKPIESTKSQPEIIKSFIEPIKNHPELNSGLLTFTKDVNNAKSVLDPRGEKRVQISRLRQKIAERLKDSQNTAAILTTFNEVDMFKVIALRNKYKDEFFKNHNVKLGFMSFFIKATVEALKQIPIINAQIDGTEIVHKSYCDIGIAVSTDKGLVVPIMRNAEKLELHEIEIKIAELATKAREGKISIDDLTGGTFSITNGGVYGSLLSTPIINPPQSGILGLHNIVNRPVAIEDKVEIRPMMYIALSYDHRIIDGKDAVTFLVNIKKSLENPEFAQAALAWN